MNATTAKRHDSESLNLSDLAAILKRRFSVFSHTLLILLALTIVLAFGLPSVYESSGTILIEEQNVPDDLVPSTITTYADERIQVISQRVMSTDNLSKLLDRHESLSYGADDTPVIAQIAEFKEAIIVEPISADVVNPSSGRPSKATIAFNVVFRHAEPAVARDIARDLVDLFLEENRRSREEQALGTVAFLESQSEAYRSEIDRIEGEIAEFKSEYSGMLPENVNFNMQSLDRQQKRLDDLQAQIRTQEERIRFLRDERRTLVTESGVGVDRMAELQEALATALARYSDDHPDVVSLRREIEQLRSAGSADGDGSAAQSVARVRQELAVAKNRYSADHPDVRRLERELASLEAQLRRGDDATALVSNPAVRAVDSEMRERQANLVSLRQAAAEVEREINAAEAALRGVPEIERQYRMLSRRYEDAVERFDEVQAKLATARMSSELESEELGERFTPIDRPRMPGQPASPNRIGILALGIVLSGAIALAALAIAEASDGRIRSSRDVRDVLGIPPIAAIPMIETTSDKRKRTMRVIGHAAFQAAVVSAAAVGLFYFAM